MRRVALALLLLAFKAVAAAAQTPQDVPATYQLRVAGPVYFPNGDVKGDPLVVRFGKFGETIIVDVTSGPTPCDLKVPAKVDSADPAAIEPAPRRNVYRPKFDSLGGQAGGTGWRVGIKPVREENGALVIEASWTQPLSFAAFIQNRPVAQAPTRYFVRGTASAVTLTLKPGTRILVDRLSVTVAPSSACQAIGIGLEIGVDSSRSTVVESEVWLVHKKPDGSETSEKQVVRTTSGTPSAYVFPRAMLGHDVYGQVSPARSDGTMDVQLSIRGKGDDSIRAGSMTFRGPVTWGSSQPFVTMTRVAVRSDNPSDVVSVPLVTVDIEDATSAAKGTHEFSLRIRSRQLR
jgi:hypothetical protein